MCKITHIAYCKITHITFSRYAEEHAEHADLGEAEENSGNIVLRILWQLFFLRCLFTSYLFIAKY